MTAAEKGMKNREEHIYYAGKREGRRWACKEREDRFLFFQTLCKILFWLTKRQVAFWLVRLEWASPFLDLIQTCWLAATAFLQSECNSKYILHSCTQKKESISESTSFIVLLFYSRPLDYGSLPPSLSLYSEIWTPYIKLHVLCNSRKLHSCILSTEQS